MEGEFVSGRDDWCGFFSWSNQLLLRFERSEGTSDLGGEGARFRESAIWFRQCVVAIFLERDLMEFLLRFCG